MSTYFFEWTYHPAILAKLMEAGMSEGRYSKVERVLGIYTRLMDGYLIHKTEEAERYGVDLRSIQRDIEIGRAHV